MLYAQLVSNFYSISFIITGKNLKIYEAFRCAVFSVPLPLVLLTKMFSNTVSACSYFTAGDQVSHV
jgi:hypothetical protein